MTWSPTRTPFLRISNRLCSVALVTVTPPTNTGASAPRRQLAGAADLHVDPLARASAISCAGYLCATAQRGSRV